MPNFPDESLMPRSDKSGDLIRGGSMGLNRILGTFATQGPLDHRPVFYGMLVSAFTLFRNCWSQYKDARIEELEAAVVTDIQLLSDYYDTYLSMTGGPGWRQKFCPVMVYLPDYRQVDKSLFRPMNGRRGDLWEKYAKFAARNHVDQGELRRLEYSRVYWAHCGRTAYPHEDLLRALRAISSQPDCRYGSEDAIGMISHVPLDFHIMRKLRYVSIIQSHTGLIKPGADIRLVLDKDGNVPFTAISHGILGDEDMLEPQVTPKVRKQILEKAKAERWMTKSPLDVGRMMVKMADIKTADLRKFDFE